MTFQTEQNLIFATMLIIIVVAAFIFGWFSYRRSKTASPVDKQYYFLALLLSALVAVFFGFHLSQVLARF